MAQYRKFVPPAGQFILGHRHAEAYVDEAIRVWKDNSSRKHDPAELLTGRQILALAPAERIDVLKACRLQSNYYDRQWWADWDEPASIEEAPLTPANNPAHYKSYLDELAMLIARPTLPYTVDDLTTLIDTFVDTHSSWTKWMPVAAVVKHLAGRAKRQPLEPALLDGIQRLRDKLAAEQRDKQGIRLAAILATLLPGGDPESASTKAAPARPVTPGCAGHTQIMAQLKRAARLLKADKPAAPTHQVGPDRFQLPADSPLHAEHQILTDLFDEFAAMPNWGKRDLKQSNGGKAILSLDASMRGRLFIALGERSIHARYQRPTWEEPRFLDACRFADRLIEDLFATQVNYCRDTIFDAVLFLSVPHRKTQIEFQDEAFDRLLAALESFASAAPFTEGERYFLSLLRIRVMQGSFLGWREQSLERLNRLIGDGAPLLLIPGLAWTDCLHRHVQQSDAAGRLHWKRIVEHALTASGSRPSAAWIGTAQSLIAALGAPEVATALATCFREVHRPVTDPVLMLYDDFVSANECLELSARNMQILGGLLWMCPLVADRDLTRAVAHVASWAYSTMPGVGPRAVKVGNACIYALGVTPGRTATTQLVQLKAQVPFRTAQREIEKACAARGRSR